MIKFAVLMGLLLGLGTLRAGSALPTWAQESTPLPSPTAPASPASGGVPVPTTPSPALTGQASPTPGLTAEQVTDEQVEQLVQILLELDPLIRGASAQLRETQDEDEYEQIMQRTEVQASRVVEEQGLTVTQYRELMTLANESPVLNQRIRVRLQQVMEEAKSSGSPEPATPVPTP
ncbi:MAG: DUF4168 domain-containing protein [Thermostichus sp. DG02_5_bins_236]